MNLFNFFKSSNDTSKASTSKAVTTGGLEVLAPSSDVQPQSIIDAFHHSRTKLSIQKCYIYCSPLRTAVDRVAENFAAAKSRLFLNDKEVIGGELYNVINQNEFAFKKQVAIWYLLSNEMVAKQIIGTGKPSEIHALDPFRLNNPHEGIVERASDIKNWNYHSRGGTIEELEFTTDNNFTTGKRNLLMYLNSFSLITARGISQMHSLQNDCSLYVAALNVANQHFDNNNVPSNIISFEGGGSEKQIEALTNRFRAMFGLHTGNSGSSYFTNRKTSVQQLSNTLKDSLLQEIIKQTRANIFAALGVPPIISNDLATGGAKYDSSNEQLESFLENTLKPMMQMYTNWMQNQLVDRYANRWMRDIKTRDISKGTKKVRNIGLDTHGQSELIFLLDPDTLSIAAKINQAKIEAAIKLGDSGLATKAQSLEYYDIQLSPSEDDDLKNRLLVNSNQKPLEDLFKEPEETPAPPEQPEDEETEEASTNGTNEVENAIDEELVKQRAKELKKRLYEIRSHTLKKATTDKRLTLHELESEIEADIHLKRLIRSMYKDISKDVKSGNTKGLKTYFSNISRSQLRSLAAASLKEHN